MMYVIVMCCRLFFFQAEDGIRDLVRSRGLGDVYKRQGYDGWLEALMRQLEMHHILINEDSLIIPINEDGFRIPN